MARLDRARRTGECMPPCTGALFKILSAWESTSLIFIIVVSMLYDVDLVVESKEPSAEKHLSSTDSSRRRKDQRNDDVFVNDYFLMIEQPWLSVFLFLAENRSQKKEGAG